MYGPPWLHDLNSLCQEKKSQVTCRQTVRLCFWPRQRARDMEPAGNLVWSRIFIRPCLAEEYQLVFLGIITVQLRNTVKCYQTVWQAGFRRAQPQKTPRYISGGGGSETLVPPRVFSCFGAGDARCCSRRVDFSLRRGRRRLLSQHAVHSSEEPSPSRRGHLFRTWNRRRRLCPWCRRHGAPSAVGLQTLPPPPLHLIPPTSCYFCGPYSPVTTYSTSYPPVSIFWEIQLVDSSCFLWDLILGGFAEIRFMHTGTRLQMRLTNHWTHSLSSLAISCANKDNIDHRRHCYGNFYDCDQSVKVKFLFEFLWPSWALLWKFIFWF
jgi:hypothetical protein